jgi:hypothetical protein
MRFVSWSANFSVTPSEQFKEKIETLADGSTRTLREGYIVRFNPSDFTDRDREAVYRQFPKEMTKGSRRDQSGMDIDNDWKISTFDTSTVPAEIRADLEKALLECHDHGRHYIMVEQPVIPAPWPKYSEIKSAKAIVQTVQALGLDPKQVAAYERENLNRDEVLAELAALEEEPVEETIEVAA